METGRVPQPNVFSVVMLSPNYELMRENKERAASL
jgi:hypothetical protein